jgi:hypothetical protein
MFIQKTINTVDMFLFHGIDLHVRTEMLIFRLFLLQKYFLNMQGFSMNIKVKFFLIF